MSEIIRLAPNEKLSGATLQRVADAAKGCKIVAFPTDTVYGLGSTALVRAAARQIYQIKGRDSQKPLPILVKSAAEAKRWAQWSPPAELLAKRFWPGGLTLILKPTKEGKLLTFAEYQTIAIRVPSHPVALKLLETSDIPWVSSSANPSGSPAPKDGATVIKNFDGLVEFIIDAGELPGKESTLVDATGVPVRILREGAITKAGILEALDQNP